MLHHKVFKGLFHGVFMAEEIKDASIGSTDSGKSFSHKIRENPWIITTFAFGALVLIMFAMSFSGALTGHAVSDKVAGNALVNYINSLPTITENVTLKNVSDMGGLYQVTVVYQGKDIPVYVTKDGKYYTGSIVPLTAQDDSSDSTTSAPKNITKNDKPIVQAFVFTYCPYGLQFEKALSPVYDLLKNKADINLVYIGAMHGEYEKVESLRQLCVLKNYGKDTLWKYLNKFNTNTAIGSCNGDASCLKPLISSIMTTLGIDENKINTCMANDAEAMYTADEKIASDLGIGGSPTFVINGVQVDVGRTPSAIQGAICDAFNTAPSECSQTLSSDAATAGFGAGAGASTGATC